MQFKDYYKILGLTPAASSDDIKLAYRRLARRFHPDVSLETNAEQKFKEIQDAYQVLKNSKTRTIYNDTVKIIRPYSYAWLRAKVKAWLDRQAQNQAKNYASMRATGSFSENQFSLTTIGISLAIIIVITSTVFIPSQFYQQPVFTTVQPDSPPDNTVLLAQLSQQYTHCLTQTDIALHERTGCIAKVRQTIAQMDPQHYLLQDPHLSILYAKAIEGATNHAQYAEARQLLIDWQSLLPDYDYHRDKLWQTLLHNQQVSKITAELGSNTSGDMTQVLGQLRVLEQKLDDDLLQEPTVKKALLNYYLNQAIAMMQPLLAKGSDHAGEYSLVFSQPQENKSSVTTVTLPFVLSTGLKLPGEQLTHSIFQLPVVESKPVNEIAMLLQKCQEYYEASRFVAGEQSALTCYQQVLQREPQNVEAVVGLEKLEHYFSNKVQIALQQKKLNLAKELLTSLTMVNPKAVLITSFRKQVSVLENSLSLQNRVNALLKQCKAFHQTHLLTVGKNSALACYQEVLEQQPNHREAWLGLQSLERTFQIRVENALQNGNLEKARNHLATLQKINPQSAAIGSLQLRLQQQTPKTVAAPLPRIKPVPVKTQSSSSAKVTPKLPKAKSSTSKKEETVPLCKKCNCGDILRQLSIGVKPLTSQQKAFFQARCH